MKKGKDQRTFDGKYYDYVDTYHIEDDARKITAKKKELKSKGFSVRTYKIYGKWDEHVDIFKRKNKK